MTRDEFIRSYMDRSKLHTYAVAEQKVFVDGELWFHALPCNCGEEVCEGWAMITPGSVGWHEFQNGRMSYDAAIALDQSTRPRLTPADPT